MKRNVYLNTVDLTEIEHVLDQVLRDIKYSPSPEIIPVTDSVHRITYNAVYAKTSSPCYNASAMDGIALDAFETYEATESTPVTIKKENFSYINTGNEIPAAYNTVIMIEDVYLQEDGSIVLYQSPKQFQHIRPHIYSQYTAMLYTTTTSTNANIRDPNTQI